VADGLAVDQLYRALDFLAIWSDRIEREVYLRPPIADWLRRRNGGSHRKLHQ
jgi:hypothetical protein